MKRAKEGFTDFVKNTYRVLLSRGLKGRYVYFADKETERFFKSRMDAARQIMYRRFVPCTSTPRIALS